MDQIRVAAEVDIAEGGIPIIAWVAEHDILTVDLARE